MAKRKIAIPPQETKKQDKQMQRTSSPKIALTLEEFEQLGNLSEGFADIATLIETGSKTGRRGVATIQDHTNRFTRTAFKVTLTEDQSTGKWFVGCLGWEACGFF